MLLCNLRFPPHAEALSFALAYGHTFSIRNNQTLTHTIL
jgi:hypothetical protein